MGRTFPSGRPANRIIRCGSCLCALNKSSWAETRRLVVLTSTNAVSSIVQHPSWPKHVTRADGVPTHRFPSRKRIASYPSSSISEQARLSTSPTSKDMSSSTT